MDQEQIKKKIFEFLNNYELGIVCTIHFDKNAPESALVGFGHNESLELIFGTSNTARKYKNLLENPSVSFVIGWTSENGSMQYEGVARELTPQEAQEYVSLLVKKNIDNANYIEKSDQRYFLVEPKWVRFLDNAGNIPQVYELNF